MRRHIAVALFTALVATGCGSDDGGNAAEESEDLSLRDAAEAYAETDPEQIEEDSRQALADAESVRFVGSFVDDGQEMELDLRLGRNDNCEGSMGIGGVGSFELLVNRESAFFRADEEFWTNQGAGAMFEVIGDRWIDASDGMGDIVSVCDWDDFIEEMLEDDESTEGDEVLGVEEVDGELVVALSFTSEDGNDGTAYILAAEPHHLVKMAVEDEGELTLSEFDEPVEPEAPADDDVVDLSELG